MTLFLLLTLLAQSGPCDPVLRRGITVNSIPALTHIVEDTTVSIFVPVDGEGYHVNVWSPRVNDGMIVGSGMANSPFPLFLPGPGTHNLQFAVENGNIEDQCDSHHIVITVKPKAEPCICHVDDSGNVTPICGTDKRKHLLHIRDRVC